MILQNTSFLDLLARFTSSEDNVLIKAFRFDVKWNSHLSFSSQKSLEIILNVFKRSIIMKLNCPMLLFTSPTCAMKHLPKLLMCQHGQKANNMFCSLVCKWVFTQTHLHTPSSIVGIDQCSSCDDCRIYSCLITRISKCLV